MTQACQRRSSALLTLRQLTPSCLCYHPLPRTPPLLLHTSAPIAAASSSTSDGGVGVDTDTNSGAGYESGGETTGAELSSSGGGAAKGQLQLQQHTATPMRGAHSATSSAGAADMSMGATAASLASGGNLAQQQQVAAAAHRRLGSQSQQQQQQSYGSLGTAATAVVDTSPRTIVVHAVQVSASVTVTNCAIGVRARWCWCIL